MSGSKWWKVVLSGTRDKYGEIISKNFNYNKQNKQTKQNKSNQNELNLTEIDENKIERNKFGFPIFK